MSNSEDERAEMPSQDGQESQDEGGAVWGAICLPRPYIYKCGLTFINVGLH